MVPGPPLALALVENALNEFGKALTFLPAAWPSVCGRHEPQVTVLQQLHAPEGAEGTVFSLLQAAGTLGSLLGRNLEWQLLNLLEAARLRD